jgi:hypothetical protein
MTYAEREARDLAGKLGFEIGDENEVDLPLLQAAITRAMAHERERERAHCINYVDRLIAQTGSQRWDLHDIKAGLRALFSLPPEEVR